jgi:transposase
MAYSVDLRTRVIDAANSGMHTDDVAKVFQVGKSTIYTWLGLKRKTGSLEPKTGYQNGHSHKVKDLEVFEKFADEKRGCSAEQMAEKWTALTGIDTKHDAISRALKKINFTHKKKSFTYSEADPKKRADYLEEISKVDPDKIVYIDETGIDDNEVPQYAWAKRGQRAHAKKKQFEGHDITL